MWCVHRQVKMIIHSWLWVLLGVRKSLKKCMKRNGSQPLNLIRKSNNISEMLRKDCSFSWTIKVKCLFWIVSAPFNFWLRSLKAYGNKFQSLFSEQQNLSVLEHFNLFFSSRRCRKIKNWCNHWISSWILSEHVDLFCLGTGIQIVHTLVISHKLTDMVLVVFAGIYLDGL